MSASGNTGSSTDIAVINCNHGGFYSVNNGRDMLGQVQKITPRKWAARVHGSYRDEDPPTYGTLRDAVAFLAGES